MITIVDDFIHPEYQDYLEKFMLSNSFPWYVNCSTVKEDSETVYPDKKAVDSYYLFHTFISMGELNSNFYNYIAPIAFHLTAKTGLKTDNPLNIRANLSTQDNNFVKGFNYRPPHVDVAEDNYITAIYYVNDSDGDTIFFKAPVDGQPLEIDQKVSPKKGRMVFFDSKTYHSGEPPIKNDKRCLINYNFCMLEKEQK